jgi:hypothetical protein
MKRNHHPQFHAGAPVEGWRANMPIIRTLVTAASIILSVAWATWKGSEWVNRIESKLASIESIASEKANARDVIHRFELICARAPVHQKTWVCTQ